MKRNIIFIVFVVLLFAACDLKDDYVVEKSAVVEAAGEWFVQYDHEVYGIDPFGAGLTSVITYNTASNSPDELWLSDEANFWWYTVKIPVNLADMTFGSTDTVVSVFDGYPIKVLVEKGRIIKDAATELPSGVKSDSIYFEIYFEDLEAATGIPSDRLQVSGYRRTGFLEDEP
jgi:hypothetical protein